MTRTRISRLEDCFEDAMAKFITAEYAANFGNNPYKLDELMAKTRTALMKLRFEIQRASLEEGK